MSGVTAFMPGSDEGFDQLAAMVTSPDEHVRCLGRAFASGMGDAVEQWLRAEQARGTAMHVLVDVIATIGLQHVACVAAQALKPGGDPAVVELVTQIAQQKLPGYIATVRGAVRGGAA